MNEVTDLRYRIHLRWLIGRVRGERVARRLYQLRRNLKQSRAIVVYLMLDSILYSFLAVAITLGIALLNETIRRLISGAYLLIMKQPLLGNLFMAI